MWQYQKGKPCLIGYASKSLSAACKNYSVMELEMFGLLMNIHSMKHLINNVDFDCAMDHLAVTHIINGKDELATVRIKWFLEKLSIYSFNLYYVKGKDLILDDYMSRINADDSDPNSLIPISFVNSLQS